MEQELARNRVKTTLMLVLFVTLISALGYILSRVFNSPSLAVSALVFGLVYAGISYFLGARMSLALNGARQVTEHEEPRLWGIVHRLAVKENLPMPKVYVMNDMALNAFATGRNYTTAVVCATAGILQALTDEELEAVMAHELGHVKNYDMRVSMLAFALSAIVSVAADMVLRATFFRDDEDSSPLSIVFGIAAALLAPLVAMGIQMSVSRSREYLADATSAQMTKRPKALMSALEKIAHYGSTTKTQHAATAHLFFANPLSARSFARLFSTHPPLEERIKRLSEMNIHG